MRKYLITSVAAVVILATGCAEMSDTQRRTATGAGVGALPGRVPVDSGRTDLRQQADGDQRRLQVDDESGRRFVHGQQVVYEDHSDDQHRRTE